MYGCSELPEPVFPASAAPSLSDADAVGVDVAVPALEFHDAPLTVTFLPTTLPVVGLTNTCAIPEAES